ncbi:MAG TPA: Dickkopf N-terminal cysteine-rich domain-containing protein [Polyangiaceae bacterium]|nr:Dickkopf N-terminal cysteine-rich domain-containing protein [Polyangiaceae bacterium]
MLKRPTNATNHRLLALLVLAGLVGCQLVGGITERSAAKPGKSCLHNSDCAPTQACLFQVCAVRCVTDVDCHAGELCLGTEDGAACVTAAQSACSNGDDCPSGTRCSSGACHTDCMASGVSACREDQTCTAQGVCESMAPPTGGTGGSGGSTAGTGGSAARGGSGGKGGTSGSSGADPGTGGTEVGSGGTGATGELGGEGGEIGGGNGGSSGGTGGSKGGTGGSKGGTGGSTGGAGASAGTGGDTAGMGMGGSAGQSMAGTGGGVEEPPRLEPGSATQGFAARFWDCCKASCGWSVNVTSGSPLHSCNQQDSTLANDDAQSACSGSAAYMCSSQSPWAVSPTLSYGFVAATPPNGGCGRCFQLQFDGTTHSGSSDPGAAELGAKTMIVQVVTTGGDGATQFDLLVPGGGTGPMGNAACAKQWSVPATDLGSAYGGFATDCAGDVTCLLDKCDAVLSDDDGFKEGCDWSATWYRGALVPNLLYAPIACPKALTDVSGLADPE